MLTEIMLAKNPVVYFKYVFFVLFILAMINFVTVLFLDYLYVIVNRYGWTAPGWFLGHRNQHVYFLLPLVIISFILKELHYHKTYFWIAFSLFISLITVVTTWSATSIVTLSLMAIYFVFIYNKKSRKIFNIKTYMFVFLMFTIILLLQFQEYFAFIIEDLLDRNLTFTMRTTIWNEAVDLIQKKPWFGHGYGEIVFRNNLESTHNAFFQILFNGGIISLILCTIILLVVVNRLKENKYNKISDILQFAIFLYLIQMLFESRLSTIFFALLVVGFHIEKLVVTTSNLNGTTPIKLSFTNMGDENIV
jgi:O-antigen ligase